MNQYINIKTAATEFNISPQTVSKIWLEIEDHVGKGKRYGSYTFRGVGKTRQVRYAVMDDYMRWRHWFANSDSRKHVPDFDVRNAEIELGVSRTTVNMVDADAVAEKVMASLIGRLCSGN